MLGRVMSIAGVLAWSAIPLGSLAGAAVIEWTDRIDLVYCVMGLLVAGIAAAFWLSPIRHGQRYLDEAREHGMLRVDHRLHLRCEVATADVLGHFWGGGTDFSAPLASALALVESERGLRGADVLMVTDGDASISDEVRDRLLAAREGELGLRLFVVAVGTDAGPLEPLADRVWRIDELTSAGTDELVDDLVAAVHPSVRRSD
jgi:hypothetical protein